MEERMVTIYALCDPDTGAIRYVGQSVNPDARIRNHVSNSFSGKARRDEWIRSLLLDGKHPKMVVLSTVPASEADRAEVEAIQEAKRDGFDLTNGHESPTGGISKTRVTRRDDKIDITFRVSPYTLRTIESIAPLYGGIDKMLMIIVDRNRTR